VPLYYEGHVYRAGSRIRVTISAPGGDQPVWSFASTVPRGKATVWLAHTGSMPSRLVLPSTSTSVPTGLPPCPAFAPSRAGPTSRSPTRALSVQSRG